MTTATMNQRKPRVLVVDNEDLSRDIIVMTLRVAGYGVAATDSGRQGAELLQQGSYDLVVTSGAAWLPKQAASDKRPPVLVAVENGDAPKGTILLRKPFGASDLVRAVDAALQPA